MDTNKILQYLEENFNFIDAGDFREQADNLCDYLSNGGDHPDWNKYPRGAGAYRAWWHKYRVPQQVAKTYSIQYRKS